MLLIVFIYLCYIFFPVEQGLLREIQVPFKRSHLEVALIFLVTVGFFYALGQLAINKRGTNPDIRDIALPFLPFVLLLTFRGISALFFDQPILEMFLRDAKALFFLSTGLFLLSTKFGYQGLLKHVVIGGIGLSAILGAEFLFQLSQGIFSRPYGSGEVNYDGTLLLCSYVAASQLESKEHRYKFARPLIVMGILCTLSRTTLLGLLLVEIWYAFHSRQAVARLLILAIPVSLAFYWSFAVRQLEFNVETMDRVWMWAAAVDLFEKASPFQILWGWHWGVPLDVNVPPSLQALFNLQEEGTGVPGTFAYNFHSFWLRLFLNAGILGLVTFAVPLFRLMLKDRNIVPIGTIIIVSGMTMGAFYTSNVAIVLLITLAGLQKGLKEHCVEKLSSAENFSDSKYEPSSRA